MDESHNPPESHLWFDFVDWADGMSGDDEADFDRQGIVRGVFQIELWHHEKVVEFFMPWWSEVAETLVPAAAAIADYAARANRRPIDVMPILGQSAELLTPTALGYPADDAEMVSAYADANRKTEIAAAVAADVEKRRAASVADFIVGAFSIPLPPWTAVALLRLFVTEFCARLIDADFALSMVPPEPRTEADYAATLHIPRGATEGEARDAVVKFAVDALVAMGWTPRRQQSTKGRRRKARPKNEGEALELDTRWFCRAVLYDEGPTEIARKAGVSRQRVQQAIKRVWALLKDYVLPAESPPTSGSATL